MSTGLPASKETEAARNDDIQHNYITIVTGTGRCGTTLMMAIFTCAGLNTGIEMERLNKFSKDGISGMEVPLSYIESPFNPKNPSVIKSPWLVQEEYLDKFIK